MTGTEMLLAVVAFDLSIIAVAVSYMAGGRTRV